MVWHQSGCNLQGMRKWSTVLSLSHVLARCPVALEQGRFKWRHDSILLQIFKIVREARNKGRAKFKLNQRKVQTKGCSKQVTVNGDIFHEFPSERDTTSETLDSIPEDHPLIMSAAEHPHDKSYKMSSRIGQSLARRRYYMYLPSSSHKALSS